MAFQFINIIVLAPVVSTILFLFRHQIKARKRWLLLPLDLASYLVLLGVLTDVLLTTPNRTDNPLLWKGVYAWHTLTIFGLFFEAMFAAYLLRSIFMGLLTVLFTIGLHESLFFLFFEIRDALTTGLSHFFTDWLQNGIFNLVLVAPAIPLFLYLQSKDLRYRWLVIVPLFYIGWLALGFHVSTYSQWDGTSFVQSLSVAATEISSWATASISVLLSIYFGLKLNTKPKRLSA